MTLARRFKYTFRSRFEEKFAKFLDECDVVYQYEPKAFPITVAIPNGTCAACGSKTILRKTVYTPDFYFPESGYWIETKGIFEAKDRKIALAWKEQIGEPILLLFQRNNWMTRRKKSRYTDWCDKHGIASATGWREIPEKVFHG